MTGLRGNGGRRPNIVLILCDDLGYGDVGVLFQNARRAQVSRPSLRTPHLDRMAADGLVLDGMYCPAPVCAPSRASLLTGTTQGHADLRDNAFDRELEDTVTLASMLGAAGYRTTAIGKWGLQGGSRDDDAPDHWPGYPTRRGFDDFFGYVRHADGHEHYPKEGLYRGPKQVWRNDTEISQDLDRCYTTDLFTARAKQWVIDHVQTGDDPFFVYLAFDTPHAVTELPTVPYPSGGGLSGGVRWLGTPGAMINTATGEPDSFVHPDYAAEDWPDVYRRHATAVRRIDDAVGDLIALLGDLRIDEDTLVLFTSDNGPSNESYLTEQLRPDFFASYGPFDGIKRDCWEGGARVGALVRAPGLVPPGRRSSHPVQFQDLMPTFADLAGIVAPARTDGVSLIPLLTGAGDQPPSTIYVEYEGPRETPDYDDFEPGRRGRIRGQMQLLRVGDHVGVRYDIKDATDPFEIYDVVADPKQVVDLAPERPALQALFQARVAAVRMPHPQVPRPYDSVYAGPQETLSPSAALPADTPVLRRSYTLDTAWVPLLDVADPSTTATLDSRAGVEPVPDGTKAMLFSGMFVAPVDGAYRFFVTGTGALVLRVHEARVLERARDDGTGGEASGTIRLARGRHPWRLYVLGDEPPSWRVEPA